MKNNRHALARAALCEYLNKKLEPIELHTEWRIGEWPGDVFVKWKYANCGSCEEEVVEVETSYSPTANGETQLERKLRLAKSGGARRVSFCLPYKRRNEALEEIAEKGMEICSVYFFDEDGTVVDEISPESGKNYLRKDCPVLFRGR